MINIILYKLTYLFFVLFNFTLLYSIDIRGVVIDLSTQQPLIGANVFINNTDLGSATDLDGQYKISNVPEGEHEIIVAYISYKTINQKVVINNENYEFDFQLSIDALEVNAINVTGTVKKGSEVKKIIDQKESKNILNTFTSSEFRKTGDSNASEVLKRITGVTIVEGKNDIVIRGLGDRYSQARVNGLVMPSTDPDKRNLPLNLFPTKIIEKIDVYKSYHPKLPGNFAGGSIDVITKSYPDKLIFKLNFSNSSNSELNVNDIYLPNDGYVNTLGDYSNFKLNMSSDQFGSKYIFQKTPVFFGEYYETNTEIENQLLQEYFYDSSLDSMGIIKNNSYGINDTNNDIWEYFYYNKLAKNSKNLESSYKRSKINFNDFDLFGVSLPKSPFSISFMNGNKYDRNNYEFGYFINSNYSNKFRTNSEYLSEYSKRGSEYIPVYDLIQEQHSFNTNFSNLFSTGAKFNINNLNFINFDYNYINIVTSKNESMTIISNDTYYELDNGGIALADKIAQKTINSHHFKLDLNYDLDQIKIKLNMFYNESTSDLNMPDMKQQTYHKNVFSSNGIWDSSEPLSEIFTDVDGNGIYNEGEPFIDYNYNGHWDNFDQNYNGTWDQQELFTDLGNGIWNEGESFDDLGNGIWNDGELYNDSNSDGIWNFTDVDGNGICNDYEHPDFPGTGIMISECEIFNDLGNGIWNDGENYNDIGNSVYDFGEPFEDSNSNGVWDDSEGFIDTNGDGIYNMAETFNDTNGNGTWDEGEEYVDEHIDYNNEKYRYLSLVQGEGENGVKPTKRTWVYGGENQEVFGLSFDINYQLNDKYKFNFLYGYDNIDKNRSFSKREFTIGTNSQNSIIDLEFDPTLIYPGFIFDNEDYYYSISEEVFDDIDSNGVWNPGEEFEDLNLDGVWNQGDSFTDLNNDNNWDLGDYIFDLSGNGDGVMDALELVYFQNGGNCDYDGDGIEDGPCDLNGDGIYTESEPLTVDLNNNGVFDEAENFTDTNSDGIWNSGESFNDINGNGICDCHINEDGLYMMESAEAASNNSYFAYEDINSNYFLFSSDYYHSDSHNFTFSYGLRYEKYTLYMQPYNTVSGEYLFRKLGRNGIFDENESFVDSNENGEYDVGEAFYDLNGDNAYNNGESFSDFNDNGQWDINEPFIDLEHPLLINANKKENSWLHAFNFIYSLNEIYKFRFSLSNTLTRPQYRELAPTKYEEFYSDRAIEGNPYLKTTKIENIDLRFEYYPNITNMYTFAIYKKSFIDPIALVIKPGSSHNYISYANSKNAEVRGFEFEFVNKLKFIPQKYGNFSVGSNFSSIESSMEIDKFFVSYTGDTITNVASDSLESQSRPMMGQSDLILNSNIGWKNNKNNFDLNLTYNYSSKRLVYIGAGEAPDEYEYPMPDLNFTTKYKISGIEFSFKIKNLLNSSIRLGSEYNNCGDDGLCKDDEGYTGPDQGEKYNIRYFTRSYKPGTSYSFTISYNL